MSFPIHPLSVLHRMLAGAALVLALACGGGGGGGKSPDLPGSTGSWGTAQALETNLLFNSRYPQVAVDGSGRALVVWYRLSGPSGPADIWAKVYEPGTGWKAEGTIESLDGDARYPVVCASGNGIFFVAWQQSINSVNTIMASRYTPGVGWEGPIPLSDGVHAAYLPAVAADGVGNAIFAWEQANDGGYYEIQALRFSASSGFPVLPTPLGTSATRHNFGAKVAMDPAGNGLVGWHRATDFTNGPFALCAVNYRVGTGWQVPATVPDLQVGVEGMDDVYGFTLAMSAAGGVIGWAETLNNTNYRPYARLWNATTGAWSAAATITTTLDCSIPEVGIEASGKVHAAWVQLNGGTWNDLYVASSTPNGTFTVSPLPVDGGNGEIQTLSLRVNPTGSAVLAWNQLNATSMLSIYGLRFEPTRGWGSPALLETDDAGHAYAPVVALSSNGNAFATWYQFDGPSTTGIRHIYANRWH